MEKFVVIMAGGSGTRLWPLSKEKKPKQFISVDDGECMLVQTINRVCRSVPPSNCFIVTNQSLVELTKEVVKDIIPHSNIISEPQKKNTAACISYTAMLLDKKLGEAVLCFVPADGYVKDQQGYAETINLAFRAAEEKDSLVVIGINPSYPSTAYGYIKTHSESSSKEQILKVIKFTEKPKEDTAQTMLESGDYLWNGGILAGTAKTIINQIRQYIPEHYMSIADALVHEGSENFNTYINNAYNEIQDISFDSAVLEKSKDIYVIRASFDWDDIGSIDTLSGLLQKDMYGNSWKGDYVALQTTNSVIYADGILIAVIGLDNMIVVGTNEAVIVCPRGRAQEVKSLIEIIKKNGYEKFL
ncbi:mannose-1-phosphate guanylyltransferase [Ruminiclostridium papyrosolvens]|uniref:Nucleotidyl transferase n=1 Tax=Ruminiclostridium papyrosolvens C7 TaxID=1330534 RepID=U4R5W1_9FIRM|nr:mannose-1-phosphate guanylyltransferase [Ruminiclostridium papyrosolvens]EPR13825.1 nucleotidyl transferase [Ruminiclostridium papyrosolvens C7]